MNDAPFDTDYAYDYDEESAGFGPAPSRDAPRPGWSQRLAAATVALGLLVLVLSWSSGWLRGSWTGLLLSLGLVAVGGCVFFAQGRRESRHDDAVFAHASSRGAVGWALALLLTGFYVALFWFPSALEGAIRLVDPLSRALAGHAADRWFLYGLLYTLAVGVFAVRMFVRYRRDRYQRLRTASVVAVQLGLAFVLPHLLAAADEPEFYFSYFWPLKWSYLWPGDWGIGWLLDHPGRLGLWMVLFGAAMSFVATPVLTYFFGKRWYCSWVCGCGALAETAGDPFRHLSSKSRRAWRLERITVYGVLLLVVVTTVLLWIDFASGHRVFGAAGPALARFYGFAIGAVFAGVVGVGFYPLLGSRVWCRFGCPQAAILGIWQKLFSRFRISTNGGQCMSCGNCSAFCEMGIDVRSYAERGENVVRASCVGCGICSAVCPRGVLKLENGRSHADRFDGADRPLDVFLDALRRTQARGPITKSTSFSRVAVRFGRATGSQYS